MSAGVGVNPLVALAFEKDGVTGEPVSYGQVVSIVATGKSIS